MTSHEEIEPQALQRAALAVLGTIVGLAFWFIGDMRGNSGLWPELWITAITFVLIWGALTFAACGPSRLRHAALGAFAVSVPATALVVWASLRFGLVNGWDATPMNVGVGVVLVFVAAPFLTVRLSEPGNWLGYKALFDAAWQLVVRFLGAWLFVGVVWLVLFLSNQLLKLVDVTIIEFLLENAWVAFGVSGLCFGLGLAVVFEMRRTISPFIILRLLRLLVPLVLVVVATFLAVTPFREFSRLFGDLSAATVLIGAAAVAITLVSAALEGQDRDAVRNGFLKTATRLLALSVPFLAGLAVWAVWLRVAQYGWTPERLLAALIAGLVLAYGLLYAGSACWPGGWMARIRAANVAMAIAVLGLCALWLTPVLDVWRISVADQIRRFEAGHTEVDQLPLWEMAHQWGQAGTVGLERLEGTETEDAERLKERISLARSQSSRFQFNRQINAEDAESRASDLARAMAVRPGTGHADPALFGGLNAAQIDKWVDGCAKQLPDGRAGCVLVRGTFSTRADAGAQAMVLYLEAQSRARAHFVWIEDGAITQVRRALDARSGKWESLPPSAIQTILDTEPDIRASGENALWIGETALIGIR